ncbi:MAG: dephospho-CoA kinase [Candidatus Marinimicrobia bacterium]|nr:dephospho-CoA kinase [Candidatus Neomarinimicrobiota bacterium]
MKNVGLTGGLGSGKSTALKCFYEQGANTLDADDIAKNMLQSDPALVAKVKEIFGGDCYDRGKLQTGILAGRAFHSREGQDRLNRLIHPGLKAQLKKYLEACRPLKGVIIVEAALLFEAGFEDVFDLTLLVTADEAVRFRRARSRGVLSEEDIRKRMALQMPESEKRSRADHVIENNGDETVFRNACKMFWETVLLPG